MIIGSYELRIGEITDRLARMINENKIRSVKNLDSYVHQEVSRCFMSERNAKINENGEIVIDIIGEGERVPDGDVYIGLMVRGLIKQIQEIGVKK